MIVLIVLAGIVATIALLWPIMRAFARRLEAKGGPDPALKAELEEMHHRLAEMEPMQARMAELEERLDFAERLLAQPRIPSGCRKRTLHSRLAEVEERLDFAERLLARGDTADQLPGRMER